MKKYFLLIGAVVLLAAVGGCAGYTSFGVQAVDSVESMPDNTKPAFEKMEPSGSMELLYANQFAVEHYEDGYAMITVGDGNRYLVVPEGKEPFEGLGAEVTVIRQPLEHIYLAATSAMDLFRELDCMDRITLSGVEASGWYIEEAKQAMESGQMRYAGKYRAPEYEMMLSEGCDLAIQSTMIYHTPEVKEQLEQLEIPVFVERSSYESHPLGRMEWLKLYGVLMGKEELANQIFDEQIAGLESVMKQEATDKKVAFFYITSKGAANVRKPGDYIARAITLAGGIYVPAFEDSKENALSTMNMEMEAFYAEAKDADYLIYNSTIDGELKDMEALLSRSPLLADFKAVQEKNVWCTGKNMFQGSMGAGDMIADIRKMLDGAAPEDMTYLYPLK